MVEPLGTSLALISLINVVTTSLSQYKENLLLVHRDAHSDIDRELSSAEHTLLRSKIKLDVWQESWSASVSTNEAQERVESLQYMWGLDGLATVRKDLIDIEKMLEEIKNASLFEKSRKGWTRGFKISGVGSGNKRRTRLIEKIDELSRIIDMLYMSTELAYRHQHAPARSIKLGKRDVDFVEVVCKNMSTSAIVLSSCQDVASVSGLSMKVSEVRKSSRQSLLARELWRPTMIKYYITLKTEDDESFFEAQRDAVSHFQRTLGVARIRCNKAACGRTYVAEKQRLSIDGHMCSSYHIEREREHGPDILISFKRHYDSGLLKPTPLPSPGEQPKLLAFRKRHMSTEEKVLLAHKVAEMVMFLMGTREIAYLNSSNILDVDPLLETHEYIMTPNFDLPQEPSGEVVAPIAEPEISARAGEPIQGIEAPLNTHDPLTNLGLILIEIALGTEAKASRESAARDWSRTVRDMTDVEHTMGRRYSEATAYCFGQHERFTLLSATTGKADLSQDEAWIATNRLAMQSYHEYVLKKLKHLVDLLGPSTTTPLQSSTPNMSRTTSAAAI